MTRALISIAFGGCLVAFASTVRAERPALAGESTFAVPGGRVLVHFATTGVDAVPAADANTDGVPDFVAEVAATAETALVRFASLGFRRPIADGALGGDDRIDLYLRNLEAADGNAGVDACVEHGCIGYVVAENDYAGFSYPSVTEGIRSVVPHELFHLVQYAHAMGQPASWTEGTAVWAVEQLYGPENGDFERFLPAFLTRSYRPFERAVVGFGDAYPYGAALWPYFLEHRFGVGAVVTAWEACDQAPFLDAIDVALAPLGATTDDAWIEFTRWNLFTGPHAGTAGGGYPDARGWVAAPREPAIESMVESIVESTGTVYIEGLSARYVPIAIADRSRLLVAATGGIRIAAWLVADGSGIADGIELVPDGSRLAATVEAGAYTLVVTGLSRGTITTAVDIAIADPIVEPEPGGCSSSPITSWAAMCFVLALPWRRRGGRRAAAQSLVG